MKFEVVLGNNFEEMQEYTSKGNTKLMALTKNLKVLANVSLDKNLPGKLAEILGPMFKPMGVPVDMLANLATVYGGLDVAVQFNSPDKLPDNVKQRVGRELDELDRVKVKKECDLECCSVLLNNV